MLYPVAIGPARQDEFALIASATKKSLRHQPPYASRTNFVAYARLNPLINDVLALPETEVLVARSPSRPSEAYGFVVFCVDPNAMTVVFMYVKQPHRRRGVAKALLGAVLDKTPDSAELLYTFPSQRFDRLAEAYGFLCDSDATGEDEEV